MQGKRSSRVQLVALGTVFIGARSKRQRRNCSVSRVLP
jgi:hypothetical protein